MDIETGFVTIGASPQDIHSVKTVQYSRAMGPGMGWERNSPVFDSRRIENYLRLAAVVGWAGLGAAEGSTASLGR